MNSLVQFFQTSPVDPAVAAQSMWLIIALPLLGAFVCGVFGKIIGRANVHMVALGAIAGSFLMSAVVFWCINDRSTGYAIAHDYGTWFAAGSFKVTLGLMADHLSGSMLMVITGIGFLIHLYSTEYMSHDDGYWRFFAYLNLFVAAMLTLVLADSMPLLFVGWEGVGMCSYLLIGFWFEDPLKAYAGRKAFVTNRIGDFGFLVASFLLVLLLPQLSKVPFERLGGQGSLAEKRTTSGALEKGPLAFSTLENAAQAMPKILDEPIPEGPLAQFKFGSVMTVICLLLLLGAAGKSAQIPLYVWLPDAMAGPTPVSALIHAATMVTSGIYLFCRLSYFVVLSPTAMATVAFIGGLTALVAALIAFSQTGLKKVLAYSTVSQLGLMFLGIGSGVFWAAFLHVVTHAFFKACLFLGAGSVMHGNADEEDITKLGGVKHEMKTTWFTFLVSTMAITGIVPLSGFFSKDAILHGAGTNKISALQWPLSAGATMGTLTALCTAFYMMRLYFLTFEGERSKTARTPHAHESGWAMTLPLVVLAFLSVVALVHGLPIMHTQVDGKEVTQTLMENFLAPVFKTTNAVLAQTKAIDLAEEHGVPWMVYLKAWVIAFTGGFAAFFIYRVRRGQGLEALEPVRKLSFNKFYVDELYNVVVIRPVVFLSRAFHRVIDSALIDTVAVKGTAWVTMRAGSVLRYLQSGDTQSYAAIMVLALVGGLLWLLTGRAS
jgi:NADH-quinone oxidoreductase subunit L